MANSKAVDNNFIFSVCASWVILLINLGHDSVQFVSNLFIPPFLPQKMRQKAGFSLKKRLYMEVQNSQAVLLIKHFLLHDQHLHFLWWLGIKQNVIYLLSDNISWHVCKTLFTRGFLLSWLSMACNIDMLSENITKLFLEETFTYVKALLIASTSAVTILQPSHSL